MEKVIELLKGERKSLKSSIRFYKEEIEQDKKGIQELQSDLFIEKHKDASCWSDDWTIHDYIKVNVESRNRAIDDFSKRLEEAEEYLSQIEKALKILKGGK
jgi:predicted RNase H-like nuclease (RuvC/YqgF family)